MLNNLLSPCFAERQWAPREESLYYRLNAALRDRCINQNDAEQEHRAIE